MPELDFKGKEFIRNHHLTVPYRQLVPVPEKSIGDGGLDDNLIIHGDNLEALKALLPRYAGKVDCVFIDPPYNTGNEGWSYNDNVNSEVMREWFRQNPVTIEDGLRHDKWCAMMWPRLKLLWELLSESGSIWITLDDNEVHHARVILDEIFGSENFIATVIWHKVFSPKNTAQHFSEDHDNLLVYAKAAIDWRPKLLPRSVEMNERFANPDNDSRGPWTSGDLTARNAYSRGKYKVISPSGNEFNSGTRYWRQSYESFVQLEADNRVWWGPDGTAMPRLKRFLSEVREGVVPQTLWHFDEVGHTQDAKKEVLSVMSYGENDDVFITPKPVALIERVIHLSNPSIILDSFAGSGTTAHAVLKMNAQDGGNRKFILVECEDYADTVTAERVRRVINGYPFTGTQRETLSEQKLTWTEIKRGNELRDAALKTKADHQADYDNVKIEVKDGVLTVIGERSVAETAPGLGETFTYCELGSPIEMERVLVADGLPARDALAEWLLFTAFGSHELDTISPPDGVDREAYVGFLKGTHVWLLYQPDAEYLQSPAAALTRDLATQIGASDRHANHLVFSPAKYVSQKSLRQVAEGRVTHALIPFSLFSLERD